MKAQTKMTNPMTAAVVAGLFAVGTMGASGAAYAGDKANSCGAHGCKAKSEKNACKGKAGCKSKNACKSKNGCKSKNACKGKNGCKAECKAGAGKDSPYGGKKEADRFN